ncbi:MGH1-like glycoside hydrolase domain-containing protein [Paenibacillus harenae]|uniref:MGH1-like glycoside hydrolase domain-containing protein n=1 Tax=Paenibacillus harenae TaxID=306543 RepID=UPI00278F2D84|nr:hypothetical protein [Paenibacillus harenae]MDQ0059068.1 hypothetical protein [Paenibacillus harenae]
MKEALLLDKLRSLTVDERVGEPKKESDRSVMAEWCKSGVKFATSTGRLEQVYYAALRSLLDCIVPTGGEKPILHEGGIYLGCWLESTGTINAELLSRFMPSVSESTYLAFAEHQREDGMLPYKITEQGPSYRQIQLVTPLARSVWNHYSQNGRDKSFLKTMYAAMIRYDEWLAKYRDTFGTGCVEAFSAFDTGHDLSPRFWHVPDTPHLGDATQVNPDSPILPFLAPDLTANVYCQRLYLARMAEELGESGDEWRAKAEQSLDSLYRYCFDETDHFFYDRDQNGQFVRVQSDVLLRVMACEVGDRTFFDSMLRRYLLNTGKFFAKYPFTSLAMDDPRFDPFSSYNSWAGPSNFLSLIRASHAFEHHGRHVELTWVIQSILSAATRFTRFAQAVSPWTGEEGFTEAYSPSILCVLDYVERLCGIMPRPSGELWFTGLRPYAMDHGEEPTGDTAYGRTVDQNVYELLNGEDGSVIYRNGERWISFPGGIRVITDRSGMLLGIIGMVARKVEGTIAWNGLDIPFSVSGNEQVVLAGSQFRAGGPAIGIVPPTYR